MSGEERAATQGARTGIERSALKEWAVLVDAMARGEIIAMVRKGGIREQRAGFQVRHDRFLLYPTFFHENSEELADRFRGRLVEHSVGQREGIVHVEFICEVAAVWTVTDLARVHSASGEYGLSSAAVESRFNYRNQPQIHVIAARVKRLTAPAQLPEIRRYLGCVSWVELEEDVDVKGAIAVVADSEFQGRLMALADALGTATRGPRPGPAE
jgi:hypothetical protein